MIQLSKKVKSELLNYLLQEPNAFGERDGEEGIITFLSELWNLRALPSTDPRFGDAYGDVYQHMINNDDWSLEYLFTERFNLLDDVVDFNRFIEIIVSPKIRKEEGGILNFVININPYLEKDGCLLSIIEYTDNGLPVYSVETKAKVKDLPVDIKQNNIQFFVYKAPSGSAKNQNSHGAPSTFPSFVLVFNHRWNDYSICSEFSLFYYDKEDRCKYIGETKIIFEEELNTADFISSNFVKLDEKYCSLGQDISYYWSLKECLGKSFESALYALRDAAFFSQIQEAFERNSAFKTSLIRTDKAERLLREAKHKIVGNDFSNLYSFKYNFLPLFSRTPIDVSFDFAVGSDNPNRIYGLIGKNGTGKTQLVTSLPYKISRKEDEFFSPTTPLFSKVIAVSYSIFDKFEIPKRTASFNYVYSGLRNENGEFITERGLLLRFHNSWKKIEEQERMNKWRKILLNFLDEEIVNKFLLLKDAASYHENWYEVDIKGFNSIKNTLSSGQSIILFIITEIVAHIRFDSLLIYDEPETHLHPNAITQLMNTIYDLVHEFESYCIIATHSPLIIRELFSKNVYVIERHGNTPSIRRIGLESFGENLTTLTDEVFGNKDVPKQYKKIIQRLVDQGKGFDEIVSSLEFDEVPLSLNARLFIKSQIRGRNENT